MAQAPENHVLWANRAACHGCLANWVRAPTPQTYWHFSVCSNAISLLFLFCYFARAHARLRIACVSSQELAEADALACTERAPDYLKGWFRLVRLIRVSLRGAFERSIIAFCLAHVYIIYD